MSKFKEKYETAMIEHRYDSYGELSFEAGVKFALEEVVNILWQHGVDEEVKKLTIINMLAEIKCLHEV